jgi:hypothetical protein
MSGAGTTYELQIDAFTPASIPMARLAEYMANFAALLGHEEHVHFDKLKPGSLAVVSRVDPVAQHKVQRRLDEVRYGTAPKTAMDSFREIDDPKNGGRGHALNREMVAIVQYGQRRSCRSGSPGG